MFCPRAKISAFLEAMGHPGRMVVVEDVLTMIENFPDRVYLSLDLTREGLSPRMGMELHFNKSTDHGAWGRLLSPMADRGWFLADKGAALISCIGSERFFGPDGKMMHLFWGVNHIKVVIGERETSVKGYIVCFLRAA